jgi:gamma-glutamylcyclotransferase (GGCT)/AIG2-like uncharacterized protein YtfP
VRSWPARQLPDAVAVAQSFRRSGRSARVDALDPDGEPIEVFVFEYRALVDHWQRLDAFEGPGYRRLAVDVSTDEGVLPASIYVLLDSTTRRNPE